MRRCASGDEQAYRRVDRMPNKTVGACGDQTAFGGICGRMKAATSESDSRPSNECECHELYRNDKGRRREKALDSYQSYQAASHHQIADHRERLHFSMLTKSVG